MIRNSSASDVEGNRQRKGPDQQTERILHLLQTRRIRLVIFAIRLGFELSLADYAIEDESDDERRETSKPIITAIISRLLPAWATLDCAAEAEILIH